MTKTVLITGASGGVGEACARHFLSQGWNVAATARSPDKFADWTKTERVAALALDVTDPASIVAALAETNRRFGPIDAVINNAGVGLAGPVEAVSLEAWRALFETNLFGVVAVTRAVIPQMRERRDGVIVNITSLTGRVGLPFMSPYDATKFAVEGFSESLRFELARFGVRVKLVEPGGVRTNFSHDWTSHPAYEPIFSDLVAKMKAGSAVAAGPEGVALVVFKAAADPSARLRYTANGAGRYLLMNRLLPDGVWRGMVASAFLGTK